MCFILGVCAALDIRYRRIPNRVVVVFAIIGVAAGAITGHLVEDWLLHLSSTMTFLALGYTLFRLGAIGGGDLKTSLLIGLVSPGLELASWGEPILEAFIISAAELAVMLLLGYIVWRRSPSKEHRHVALVPLLFAAYLIVQVVALI